MKTLFIGIDQSFHSTGLTINYLEKLESKEISFYRFIYDDQSRKKKYIPKKQKNINQIIYKLPINIPIETITDSNDNYSINELNYTLQSMILTKNIMSIILKAINKYSPSKIHIGIEGHIMQGGFVGNVKMQSLSQLVLLQSIIRNELIKIKLADIENKLDYKLYIISPSEIKRTFAFKGNADKTEMINSFYENFDGNKLIPYEENNKTKIDDIIDSFAIMTCIYRKNFIKYSNKLYNENIA